MLATTCKIALCTFLVSTKLFQPILIFTRKNGEFSFIDGTRGCQTKPKTKPIFRGFPTFIDNPFRKARAASTNCGSFRRTSACRGVLVLSRRVRQVVCPSAPRILMFAAGIWRFQYVYKLRRYRSAPELCVNFARDEPIALGPKKLSRLVRMNSGATESLGQKTADG